MLSTIPLDSGQRNYEDAFKLDIYLKITQLQLEADDSVAAESSLNRATALVSQSSLGFLVVHSRFFRVELLFLPSFFMLRASHPFYEKNEKLHVSKTACQKIADPVGPE